VLSGSYSIIFAHHSEESRLGITPPRYSGMLVQSLQKNWLFPVSCYELSRLHCHDHSLLFSCRKKLKNFCSTCRTINLHAQAHPLTVSHLNFFGLPLLLYFYSLVQTLGYGPALDLCGVPPYLIPQKEGSGTTIID